MTRLARLPVALGALGLVLACQGERTVTPRIGGMSAAISDGNHSGSTTLFFLPPLVANPTGNAAFDDVSPNSGIPPAVEICPLDDLGGCGPRIVRYTATSGDGLDVLTFDAARRHFFVNWHTDHFELLPETTYRIRVLRESDDFELGFADVDVVGNGKELRSVSTDEFIPLLDGRTLAINFQMKLGQFCNNTSDCAEQVVTAAGGDVVTNTGFAAASFPDGWLPGEHTEVVVVIERVDLSGPEDDVGIDQTRRRCHEASALEQAEGCYHFRTIPDLGEPEDEGGGGFDRPVRVEVCIELPETDPQQDLFQLHESDDPEEEPVALNEVEDLLVNCNGFGGFANRSGGLMDLVRGAWRGINDVLASIATPRPLHATTVANVGLGGETGSFSDIGWARPATVRLLSEPDQPALVGTDVPSAPMVKVVTLHPQETPVGGAQVLFTVVGGGGKLDGLDVFPAATGTDGIASVPWTVGSKLVETANRVMVSTPSVDNSPIFFTARALIRQNDPTIGCPADPISGYGFRIVIDWADVAGATGYQIVVQHQGSALPAVDEFVEISELTDTACNTLVTDANLSDWQWRFRTQRDDETLSEWSAWFSFAFAPCRLEDGSACSAPPIN